MIRKLPEDFPTKPKRPFEQSSTHSSATIPLAHEAKSQSLSQLTVEQYSNFFRDRPTNLVTGKVMGVVVGCEDLISRLDIQSRWNVYQLERHVIVLVGPVCLTIESGTEIAVYFPENYNMLSDTITGKPAIKIQRKLTAEGLYLMGYPYLIYEPSDLAYPTLICQWITCYRRNTLKGYFGKAGHNEESLTMGNIAHSILQGLGEGTFVNMTFKQTIRYLYQQYMHELYLINSSYEVFQQKCVKKIETLWNWYDNHVQKQQPIALEGGIQCIVQKVIGNQVKIRSKVFGFKGIIDMLIECTIERDGKITKGIVPFELKTAENPKDYHAFQVDLYNLMLCQKFGGQSMGIIYYPTIDKAIPVITSPLTIYQLLIRRNEVIRNNKLLYEGNHIKLPYFSSSGQSCGKCEYSRQCIGTFIARRPYSQQKNVLADIEDLEEEQEVPVFTIPNLKNTLVKLSHRDRKYMKKWIWMLHLEEKSFRQDTRTIIRLGLHVMTILNFEDVCRALQKTLVSKNQTNSIKVCMRNRAVLPKVNQSQDCKTSEIQPREILHGYWKKGERVLITIGMIKLSERGEISQIERDADGVKLEVKLFNKMPGFRSELLDCVALLDCKAEIEKYEKGPFGELRSRVVSIACSDMERDKVKQIVIGDKRSAFGLTNQLYLDYLRANVAPSTYFNPQQKEAIKKALTMDFFSLIEGMPGTGKTEVIVRLLEIFYELNLKVLITSYTNTSLDTILVRAIKLKRLPRSSIIRQGSASVRMANSDINDIYYQRQSFSTVEDIAQFFESKKMWFVTLSSLALDHIPSDFNIVIVDQASQCLEPLCISALYKGKKFILIGDYRQLQPLVKNEQAASSGMSISLFERLCSSYSELKTPLKKQFRMCQEIMALSNSLVYDGLLESANQQTAMRRLTLLPPLEPIPTSFWPILSPIHPIVFLDSDQLSKYPSCSSSKSLELNTVLYLYSCLRRQYVPRQNISIISFYNQTTNLLVERLKKNRLITSNQGDVLTVDKSQGIDKECILFLIQEGADQSKLAGDIRRINVSLTRAKSKLIIVASKIYTEKILGGKLVNLLEKDRMVISNQMLMEITQKQV